MNVKEGFKPNKLNLTISVILGIIFGFIITRLFAGGPTGLFYPGIISDMIIPFLIIFVIIYIIVSLILSFIKK